MTDKFSHIAKQLQEEKKLVFTAQSCKNFHLRMLICKFVFEKGFIPINPFNMFGYYLYELVDRNLIRNGNNNLLKRCDELWVFGEISDGVLVEIEMYKDWDRLVKYFDISKLPEKIIEIEEKDILFEPDIEKNRKRNFI